MEKCENCGSSTVPGAEFCHSCGARLTASPEQGSRNDDLVGLPMPPGFEEEKSTGGSVEGQGEGVAFATGAPLVIGGKRWRAYVTRRKIVLHRTVGLLFTKESHQEVDLHRIQRLAFREEGKLLAEYYLDVDGITMKGRKSDLINLYRVVQAFRSET